MSDDPRSTLGVYLTFGLGQAWPELKSSLMELYKHRVSDLPWIPGGWLADVQALQAYNPNSIVRLAPASLPTPVFCDTAEKVKAWQDLYRMTDAAVNKYAAAKAVEGRALMDDAYTDASFWDRAYSIAVTIRDLPGNAVAGVLDGAQTVTAGIFKGLFSSWLFWLLALGAGGLVAWKFGLLKLAPSRK